MDMHTYVALYTDACTGTYSGYTVCTYVCGTVHIHCSLSLLAAGELYILTTDLASVDVPKGSLIQIIDPSRWAGPQRIML